MHTTTAAPHHYPQQSFAACRAFRALQDMGADVRFIVPLGPTPTTGHPVVAETSTLCGPYDTGQQHGPQPRRLPERFTTVAKGTRVGVNRHGEPVGYAVRTSRRGQPEAWTAFVYMAVAPFDYPVPGFDSADAAVLHIAQHGEPNR